MMQKENLGAADRIITAILTYCDHCVHNRPGIVSPDPSAPAGVKWEPCTHKMEEGRKVVYRLVRAGKKTNKVRVGIADASNQIREGTQIVGRYQPAGLFEEMCVYTYRQVAEVWKLDNEFAARWASYAFKQEHRDLKVVLTAFMLVQSRKGDPVMENGKFAFSDDDYRAVGEAMTLIYTKGSDGLSPKLLARIEDLLKLPGVAAINRELGFGKSAREPFLGRYDATISKWLRYREENPKLLEGLVKSGFRTTVIDLCKRSRFKPETGKFFETLRWKQDQAGTGHRTIMIGTAVKAAETWEGLSEEQICQKIVQEKPNYKRVVGMLPRGQQLTRAIVAAAVEAGCLSDKDLVIATPTLEDLGLLKVQDVRERWEKALKNAEDTRAINIASRVRNKDTVEKLQESADTAMQKAVEKVVKDMEVYVIVDISGSMQGAIEAAKGYLARFVQAFPLDHLHVSVFNTTGREVQIKHASAAGVENAFRGIQASGGTDYGAGVRCLEKYKPKADRDVLFIFFGDEEAGVFDGAIRQSGLNPMAFGFCKTVANSGAAGWRATTYGVDNNTAVRQTAANLGIPCVMLDVKLFEDVYAIPRTIQNLIASTPVTKAVGNAPARKRESLVDVILATPILSKPAWA